MRRLATLLTVCNDVLRLTGRPANTASVSEEHRPIETKNRNQVDNRFVLTRPPQYNLIEKFDSGQWPVALFEGG